MAHSFRNLGFEDAGLSPGLADGWEFDQLASGELFAEYGPDIPGAPTESFERGWLENENFKFDFDGLLIDIFPALYDDPSAPQSFEDFDQEWSDNQFFAFDFGGVSADVAQYDSGIPQGFEDFEEEWDSNESYLFDFVGIGTDLTAASYDADVPEDFEDFEDEWDGHPGTHDLIDQLFEVAGVSCTFAAPDTVTRASGSFIADELRAGGLVQFLGATGNGGAAKAIRTVSALTLTMHDAIVNEGPIPITLRNVGVASFDATPQETFEVTWTAMSTVF